MIIFFAGNVNPEFFIALLTRSFASDTAASGNPTMVTPGSELFVSVSTRIL